MQTGLRWRILILQGTLVLVFAFCAGFLYWAANFTHDNVSQQLSAQKISMPTSAAFTGLSQADINALKPYVGQQMTNGDQAKAYADHFIARHLSEMGFTYSQISGQYMTLTTVKHLPPTNPTVIKVGSLRNTIFMGTMLRSSLLNAYAWWTIGTYAFYAAIGLTVAAVAVFVAFLFELLVAPRRRELALVTPVQGEKPVAAAV